MSKSVICDLLQLFKTGVSAVLPANLIRKFIKYNSTNQQLTIADQIYNLQEKNVYLVGFGKAVQNMANEVENILKSNIKQGIISIPEESFNFKSNNKNVTYYEGAKDNLPDVKAESTAKKIKELVTRLGKDDLLLVLISGGGSALLPLPKDPITLVEKTQLIKKLANSGADITELNSVRKIISDLKGGKLALKAQPAQIVSLVLSDIVGDPLDLIASGPTTKNEDNHDKAITILEKYKLLHDLPESIKTILNENIAMKTFPEDRVKNYVIGSNKLSISAVVNEAKSLRYLGSPLSSIVTGNVTKIAMAYSILAKALCQFLLGRSDREKLKKDIEALSVPGLNSNFVDAIDLSLEKDLCLVLGGEITVEVKGNGKGGRNQQLALEFSKYIHNMRDDFTGFDVYLLSAGTDGIDGPTDAAGAIGHLNLIAESEKECMNVDKYLENNDAYNFYKNYKNGNLHVITGHTNTNVMDIHLILIRKIKL